MTIKLSILILTVPSRLSLCFLELMRELHSQVKDRGDVEILALYDNKARSIGRKRNDLLAMSQGKYIAFIDDDDRVSKDYVKEIVAAIDSNPGVDLINFNTEYIENGTTKITYPDSNKFFLHSHFMVWERALALSFPFPDKNIGEDTDWSGIVTPLIKSEKHINKILYHYQFSSRGSESRPYKQ